MTYRLRSPHLSPFWIDPDTGEISLTVSLDRELQNQYSLMVSVFDGMHTEYAQLDVTVADLMTMLLDSVKRDSRNHFRRNYPLVHLC